MAWARSQIGLVILVTGIAQLVTAPIAVQVDRYVDARLLSAIGFAAFAIGLLMSGFQTIATGYDEMFWPQVVRGAFVALCILPPIRFALGFIPREHIADASGLFNLSRNLGGAIGIALIDTIVFSRGPEHADRIMELIKAGSSEGRGAFSASRWTRCRIRRIPWALWESWMLLSRPALPPPSMRHGSSWRALRRSRWWFCWPWGRFECLPRRCRPGSARKFILIENMVNDLTVWPRPSFPQLARRIIQLALELAPRIGRSSGYPQCVASCGHNI